MRALEVQPWLEGQGVPVTLAVGRKAILALHSLGTPEVDVDLEPLGPVVGAIVTALRACGYNVFAFTQWRESEDRKASLALEAQVWANLLCEALGFRERLYFLPTIPGRDKRGIATSSTEEPTETEPQNSKTFWHIIAPYLTNARDHIEASLRVSRFEKRKRFQLVQDRLFRAQRAAKRALRETLYSVQDKEQL